MREHVLMVGGGSPLCLSACEILRSRGYHISLLGRNPFNQKEGFYCFDLNKLEQIESIYDQIVEEQGPIRRMCFFQRFRGDGDPWEGEINVSLKATSQLIKKFSAQGASEEDRSIVILTSPADSRIILEQPMTYHIAKAGLTQMVRYYAHRLGSQRIRVNGIKPGIVLKPRAHKFYEDNPKLVKLFESITPLGRMALPEDVANLVFFLSSKLSSFITGQIVSIDGGMSLHEGGSLARYAASIFESELEDTRWSANRI